MFGINVTEDFLSFKLSDKFVNQYVEREAPFGWMDAGGNRLGELVFLDKYSRKLEDGTKERWYQVCRRVIEGMYSIQKDWAKTNVLPWNNNKAQRSAEEAYDLLFDMKWTPPGRGLSAMGTWLVNGRGDSTPLQNCAGVSTLDMTKTDPSAPFCFLMNVSMLGVGVGYDLRGAEKEFIIHEPGTSGHNDFEEIYTIPDSREGWVESLRLKLESYLIPNRKKMDFDYSQIRPRGELIKTFGGIAPGPEPLKRLHKKLDQILGDREGEILTSVDITDIANLVGVCVVSGNVRRSALLAYGGLDDKNFLNLKNPEVFPVRNSYESSDPGWAWMSNNSVRASVASDLSGVIDGISRNGEPGIIWEDVTKAYGRLGDLPNYKDSRFAVFNPCSEQPLESYEMCTLVDIHLSRLENGLPELNRVLKYAYLYAKTVTLLPTGIPKTNAIMQRNRRIGISMSGVADYMDNTNRAHLRLMFDQGYQAVRSYDRIYSEWLCVRESIKVTTVKPTGTTGLLVGESPGVHWSPGGTYFIRSLRLDNNNPLLELLREAGYDTEPASESPDTTSVVYFPIQSVSLRSEKDVSIYEKIALAVEAQKWWSDNGVSVTVSFDAEDEKSDVARVLEMYTGQLKSVSFLPMGNKVYLQQPYTQTDSWKYNEWRQYLKKVDLSPLYDGDQGLDAEGEFGCSTDICEVRSLNQ